ncbi:pectin acetylesterase-family hydrolase [Pseudomaricurvus sp.]|uniref:pectin acetylesterase-family hydrolase n=1 Tax=Pseudomaricurvus sp. TaxID=2004510 RepID=UPI003F6D8BC4
MLKKLPSLVSCLFSLALCQLSIISYSAFAAEPWQEINLSDAGLVNESGEVIDSSGNTLTDAAGNPLIPNCALTDLNVGESFKFFFQPGKSEELVIFHTGGGACWENNTCGSALIPGGDSTYTPIMASNADLLNYAGGIFDTSAGTNNPYADASKVYIPYCTGDIGWGNRDVQYVNPLNPTSTYTVHHRGYANIRAVSEWITRMYSAAPQPQKVLVSGSSAGGYAAIGTLLPEIEKVIDTRKSKVSVVVDSSNAVVNNRFLVEAGQAWGIKETLPAHMLQALDGDAIGLGSRFYLKSTKRYPEVLFGQYQNTFDIVQGQFLNIMKHLDHPELWNDPVKIQESIAEWSYRMTLNTQLTALLTRQYRFYTAAGFQHVVLEYVPSTPEGWCSDNFTIENSANSLKQYQLPFYEWSGDLFKHKTRIWWGSDWLNATCGIDCLGGGPTYCP